jgi:hypothetical protein
MNEQELDSIHKFSLHHMLTGARESTNQRTIASHMLPRRRHVACFPASQEDKLWNLTKRRLAI